MRRFDLEVVRRWVEESCAAQGVEAKVSESEALGSAAALLREGRSPQRTVTTVTPASESAA